jgi:hypothetical protein
VEFFNPPGSAGLRLELPRRTPIEVAVVDGTGRPVEGSLLQLVEWPLGQALTAESEVADPGSRAALLGNTPRGPAVARLLDSARSDAEGRTTLYSGRAAGPLAVRALGPGHVPAVCAQVATHSRGTPLTLVVDRGATLRGTVAWIGEVDAVARTLATAPHLEFTQGQDGSASPLRRCSARVAADGSFRVDALAPGRWEIQARFQGQDGQEVRRRILPPVDLDPGETRGLALEIPR